MIVFAVQRHAGGEQGRPGLDITGAQQAVLAVGTTLGVLGMAVVPLVSVRRAGLRLRPRWDLTHPEVRGLGRPGLWAAAFLAFNQSGPGAGDLIDASEPVTDLRVESLR